MNKYLFIILIFTLAQACNSGPKRGEANNKRVLTVTIEPQRYFLDQIVGDAFTINTLVPPGTSPETYEPAPSAMIEMGKSVLYFKVGSLGFENAWTARLSSNNPDVGIVDCSTGIELMGGHDHSHSDEDSYLHGAMDPHVWSSPRAVKIFAGNMLDAIVNVDTENEELYLSKFEKLSDKIDRTDSLIRNLLQHTPSRSFIIYHPALGYFAKDYGLRQYSVEFEGKSPSPSQIKDLIDIARREKINTIFIQRGFDIKNAEVIAKEINAKVFEIDPLKYEWDEELLRIASILARETDE
ncbi:MAG: zinc ABC transporter substrate-binding protein [Proteiniphilum sp.]|nr:zinc ABC transporter substrate-binding protein [Proteiniphilum sp.]MDD3909097.1 zinc ABC transporter substrate-binding protein [Proteiniphilum sp.]MDD4416832.1 zinc ABC transporter substrate-binding protein [Proteiniphilum sp.]